ncbi:hypothetical protein EC991_004759 [Linnemannia zychae]|nr:hypothetical protein EC991_004759 [Linnemannia zychae]
MLAPPQQHQQEQQQQPEMRYHPNAQQSAVIQCMGCPFPNNDPAPPQPFSPAESGLSGEGDSIAYQPEYLRPHSTEPQQAQQQQPPIVIVQSQPEPQVPQSQPQILVSQEPHGCFDEIIQPAPEGPQRQPQNGNQAQEQEHPRWGSDQYVQYGGGGVASNSVPTTPFEYYNLAQNRVDTSAFVPTMTAATATGVATASSSNGSSVCSSRSQSTTSPPISELRACGRAKVIGAGVGSRIEGGRGRHESHTWNEIGKILRRDDTMDDFIPPPQAMNSDESDFDWDEDVNIDGDDKNKAKKKEQRSTWRQLAPFLRMLILIITVAPILALPAVLTAIFLKTNDDPHNYDRQNLRRRVAKDAVVVLFGWFAFMWCIICINNWVIDLIPAAAVMVCSWTAPTKVETLKSRLLIFVGTKKYIKWFIDACWALAAFVVLSKMVYPLVLLQVWQVLVIRILVSVLILVGLILLEKIILHKISKNFHQIAYADRISENKYALAVLDRLGTSRRREKDRRARGGGYASVHSNGRSTPVTNYDTEANATIKASSVMDMKPINQLKTNSWDHGYPDSNVHSTADLLSDPVIDGGGAGQSTNLDELERHHHHHHHNNHHHYATKAEETDGFGDGGSTGSNEGPFIHLHRHHTQHLHVPIPTVTPHATMALQTNNTHHNNRKAQRDVFKGLNRKLHVLARADTTPSKDINSTENAKRLARTLFHNLQQFPDADQLVVEDFFPYFTTEDDARKAFALFDKDGNGDISKREMKEKIFYIYKERKDLHTALRDLSQAVGKLDIIFLTIAFIIWLIVILSVFGASVVQNMLSVGSFLVALSFVFGNSLRTLFENIVFLFITHPYDSGDLCDIDGTFMYVREVGLNSTMFVSWDGRRIYYPNNVLSQKAINNIRRSPNMTDKIVVHIDVYTPQEKIFELRARMREFLAKETKEFSPDMEIQIQEIDVRLKISMCIEHKGNWQESSRRWARRTRFHYALKEAIEDLGIKYHHIPERISLVQSEGLSALISAASRNNNFLDGHGGYNNLPHPRSHHEGLNGVGVPFHPVQGHNETETASSPALDADATGVVKKGGQAARMMVEGERERATAARLLDSDRGLQATPTRRVQRRRTRRTAHDAGGGDE